MQVIELECATISLRSDGIIHIHTLIHGTVSMEDSKLIVEARTKLAENKPYPMLYTSETPTATTNEELTEYMASEERNRLVLADAFVIRSFTQRLAVKMYFVLKKPKKPTSFFANEADAITWLKNYTV